MKNLVDSKLKNVFLKPGEVYVSKTPALVSTVLGSCISVTMYSAEARVGVMCHALLPSGYLDEGFRYVNSTVEYLFDKIKAISGQSGGFEAKLFGGAEVLYTGDRLNSSLSVGSQNVAAALNVINKLGLSLVASDTSGDRGRKIFFYSNSGEVFLRHVKKTIR